MPHGKGFAGSVADRLRDRMVHCWRITARGCGASEAKPFVLVCGVVGPVGVECGVVGRLVEVAGEVAVACDDGLVVRTGRVFVGGLREHVVGGSVGRACEDRGQAGRGPVSASWLPGARQTWAAVQVYSAMWAKSSRTALGGGCREMPALSPEAPASLWVSGQFVTRKVASARPVAVVIGSRRSW